ncbi:MAG: hypothetical protein ACOC2N_08355, partial [Spirochaetota bacterium]
MSGLYQRAVEYLKSQRHLRLVRPGEDDQDEFAGTPEERAQIEREIRSAVEENRISVGPETFRVQPQRGGVGLPLLVNLVALLVIAGGVYLLLQVFADREHNIASQTSAIVSAEGRLLSALRVESEARLSEKESEIADIERRLAQVEAERQQIRSEAKSRLEEQETVLRAEFDDALEAERSRLAAEELSDTERATRLDEFRQTREAELGAQLAALEAEAAASLREQEEAIASVVTEYEGSLREAQAERESLESELRDQQAELQAQFEQREAQLSGERAAAVETLEELRAQQEEQRLILDQILGFYGGIREQLAAGRLDSAEAALVSLR